MKELDCVKVIKLVEIDRDFDGTAAVKRKPKLGDIGTIVDFYENSCIVECVDTDGHTVWLADFSFEELDAL